jgi:hypothetical protein
MPSASLIAADAAKPPGTSARAGQRRPRHRPCPRASRSARKGRITRLRTRDYAAAPPIVSAPSPDTSPPAEATDIATASKDRPTTSSTAAAVNTSEPSGVSANRVSARIRARTGNAVTDIDTPMNSANEVNGTSLLSTTSCRSWRLSHEHKPQSKRQEDRPDRNRGRRPTVAAQHSRLGAEADREDEEREPHLRDELQTGRTSAGKSSVVRSPGSAPSRLGPRRKPARISPTTRGSPTRASTEPTTRAAPRINATSRAMSAAVPQGGHRCRQPSPAVRALGGRSSGGKARVGVASGEASGELHETRGVGRHQVLLVAVSRHYLAQLADGSSTSGS